MINKDSLVVGIRGEIKKDNNGRIFNDNTIKKAIDEAIAKVKKDTSHIQKIIINEENIDEKYKRCIELYSSYILFSSLPDMTNFNIGGIKLKKYEENLQVLLVNLSNDLDMFKK